MKIKKIGRGQEEVRDDDEENILLEELQMMLEEEEVGISSHVLRLVDKDTRKLNA